MKHRFGVAAAGLLLLLTGCGGASESYQQYVDAVMNCTYRGETEAYQMLTGVDDSAAQAVYDAEAAYIAELLCYQATVDTEHISDETRGDYQQLAKTLMGRFHYSTAQTNFDGTGYRVTVNAEPVIFWDKALPALERVYKQEFSERFYKAPPDSQERFDLEAEWGERTIVVLTPFMEEITYGEPETVVVNIRADASGRYTIAEQDLQTLDRILMHINS